MSSRYVFLDTIYIAAFWELTCLKYYQTNLYRSLGMNRQMVLTLAALWATCGFLANAISLRFLAHRLGRRT